LIDDKSFIAGAAAFEVAAYCHLMQNFMKEVKGKAKLGV
jgi:hypothetical protein